MRKVLSFTNAKGGVGKSHMNYLVALEIADRLEKENLNDKRVLLIDGDEQIDITENILSKDHGLPTMAEALCWEGGKGLDPENVIVKSPIAEFPRLDFIPAGKQIAIIPELLADVMGKEKKMRVWLRKHKDFFEQYSHILIDISPTKTLFNRMITFSLDSLIMPLQWETLRSIEASKQLLNQYHDDMDNLEIDERAKIVAFINLHKTQRTSVSKEFERALDEELEVKNMMINSVISDSAVVKQSFINKTTIAKYTDTARVNTKCKEQFNDFIQELTDMEVL